MSTRYIGEQATRRMMKDIFQLLESAAGLTVSSLVKTLKLTEPQEIERLRRQTRYLNRRGYLSGTGRTGYAITALGRQKLADLNFTRLELHGKWDHRWRIVMFDIPEAKRPARDAIRRLVKQLGFIRLQQSAWIHPLPCLEQFERIRSVYGVRDHIMLFEVAKLDRELEFLRHFRKVYPDL